MPDFAAALETLALRTRGVRAAVVVESQGIEVAAWGEADFETAAAELADLWRQARSAEGTAVLGDVESFELVGSQGAWVLVPLGGEYVLGVLAGPGVAPGRVRFHAREWAHEHEEDFR